MQIEQLERLYLFYFSAGIFKKINELNEKYYYFSDTKDIEIIKYVTKIFTDLGDSNHLIEQCKGVANFKNTKYFRDNYHYQFQLAFYLYEQKIISYEDLIERFDKADLDDYYNNQYECFINPEISVFSTHTSILTWDAVKIIRNHIHDKEIFLDFIPTIKDLEIKANLSIEYAMENDDYSVGMNAIKILLKEKPVFNLRDWKSALKSYTKIVEFGRYFQQHRIDFYKTPEYDKLLEIFKSTPFELNVHSILIFEEPKEKMIQIYNECIERLSKLWTDDELEEHKAYFLDLLERKMKVSDNI